MSRSERYIPPSDEELEGWQQAKEAAKRCDEQRAQLPGASEWALKMLRYDRTSCICRRELTELAEAIHSD